MNKRNESRLTVSNAKETTRRTRYRSKVTEAEFYRPLAQLYDEVESNASRKKLGTWGWSFASTGATHLITSVMTEIPDTAILAGVKVQYIYTFGSAVVLCVGLVLIAISQFFPRSRPKDKEALLKKYIDQEFDDEACMSEPVTVYAPQIADNGKDI